MNKKVLYKVNGSYEIEPDYTVIKSSINNPFFKWTKVDKITAIKQ